LLIVERLEGEFVVLEGEAGHFNIERGKIRGKIKEGDIVTPLNDGTYTADKAATEKRRCEILRLQDGLFDS